MNILFFSTYSFSPHFEIELELIKKEIDAGHNVFILRCDKKLSTCMMNPNHTVFDCLLCQSKVLKGYELIGVLKSNIFTLDDYDTDNIEIPFFNTVEELKSFQYDGVNYGMGCVSSCISLYKKIKITSHDYHEAIVKHLKSAIKVSRCFDKLRKQLKIDLVYLFNGRFNEQKAVVSVCKQNNLKFITHERGGRLERYATFDNTLLHNAKYIGDDIIKVWNNHTSNHKYSIAQDWYLKRKNGQMQNWTSFTKDQEQGVLPQNFDNSKRNVGIFNSSADEYEGVENWDLLLYENEFQAINEIAQYFISDDTIHFYLRVHPNLKGRDNEQTQALKKLKSSNLTLIEADQKIHSYDLLDACDVILTFGSTMGIEATYWGKPSAIINKALYFHLGAVFIPKTKESLYNYLKESSEPMPVEGALQYAFWEHDHGFNYELFEPIDLFTIHYNGKPIQRHHEVELLRKKEYRLNRLSSFIPFLTKSKIRLQMDSRAEKLYSQLIK